MRDQHQMRCYRGMKLASWLLESSYWQDTLTQGQVMYLVNRVLNNVEVYGRWELTEVTVLFPTRGSTAWARRIPGKKGRGEINLPPGTRSPLVILHELAHLLPPKGREAMHGPGFSAVHLMLVDLFMSNEKARVLAGAYQAMGTPVDPSKIPANEYKSNYVPIVGDANLQETIKHLGTMVSSGLLSPEETAAVKRTLTRLRVKARKEPQRPLKPLPEAVTIQTRDLLRANSAQEVANLVTSALRKEMLSERMTAPPKPKKKPTSNPRMR